MSVEGYYSNSELYYLQKIMIQSSPHTHLSYISKKSSLELRLFKIFTNVGKAIIGSLFISLSLIITPTITLADVADGNKKPSSFASLFTQHDPYKSGGLKDSEGCSGFALEHKQESDIEPKQDNTKPLNP